MTEPRSLPAIDDADAIDRLQRLLSPALAPIEPDAASCQRIRANMMSRVRASLAAGADLQVVRRDAGEWRRAAAGVRVKLLSDGGDARSMLVAIDAGGTLPAHRHHGHEQCVVLRGRLQMGELELGAGDYHEAPAGSRHDRLHSRNGALIFLRGASLGGSWPEILRELITAWLPGSRGKARTVRAGEDGWLEVRPGVRTRLLHGIAQQGSMLVRVQPGMQWSEEVSPIQEECLVIEGEAFLDDTLLRAGEFMHGALRQGRREVDSDVGATLYLHRTPLPSLAGGKGA
jgi:quercetin dioxygenase-like cupin family protein